MHIERPEADLTVAKQLKEQAINILDIHQKSVSSMSKEIDVAIEEAQELYEATEKSIQHLPSEAFKDLSEAYFSISYEPVNEIQEQYKSVIDEYHWLIKQLEALKDKSNRSEDKAVLRRYLEDIEDREVYWMEKEPQA